MGFAVASPFSILGLKLANLNYLTILALLAGLTLISLIFFEFSITPTLAQMSFILLAIVMIVSKVYSPQYVLWLTPLAILAINKRASMPFGYGKVAKLFITLQYGSTLQQ